MLKKAGIVAAVATAGVLALTPFAFADNDTKHHEPRVTHVTIDEGDINRDQMNECTFDQERSSEATVDLSLGDSQAQNGNCVNVGDDSEYTAPESEDAGVADDLLGGILGG